MSKGGAQNGALTGTQNALYSHLESPDLAKRRVALGVLEGLFVQKGQPIPPQHILRPLLYCLCTSDAELITRAMAVLGMLVKKWAIFGTHLVAENMGLAMVWLFIGTYKTKSVVQVARDMLEEIQDRSMYAIQSPSTEAFVGHLADSARTWIQDGVYALAHQILTITAPKLPQPIQRVIEKESNTVPLLVYFFMFLPHPTTLTPELILPPKLDNVVADDGMPFMKQQFLTGPNNDAKAAALQGIRSYTLYHDDSDIPLYDEIIKCIASTHKVLQQEALLCTNDIIPESYNKTVGFEQGLLALEFGGEEAATFLERITRKEKRAILFAKCENAVPTLMNATKRVFKDEDNYEDSSFLALMLNVALTEPGRKGLAEQDAVTFLRSMAHGAENSHPNRLRAAIILDALNEDLEDVFNEDFVTMTRGHWGEWVNALADLPPHYSSRFVQTKEDATELIQLVLRKEKDKATPGALNVLINTLSYLYCLPFTKKAQNIPKINLIAHHELVPALLQQLLKQYLDPDKITSNLKLVFYAALSIANNAVRLHVVEEGNIPLLLSLLQNPSVGLVSCVVQALTVIAWCSVGEFIKHGGLDAFGRLIQQGKYIGQACEGLWAVMANDPEGLTYTTIYDHLQHITDPDTAFHGAWMSRRRYNHLVSTVQYAPVTFSPTVHIPTNSTATSTKSKSNKKKSKPQQQHQQNQLQPKQKYVSIRDKLLSFSKSMAAVILGLSKDDPYAEAEHFCVFADSMVQWVDTNTTEYFPEYKQIIDSMWCLFSFRNLTATSWTVAMIKAFLRHWNFHEIKLQPQTRALLSTVNTFGKEFEGMPENENLEVEGLQKYMTEFNVIYAAQKAQFESNDENSGLVEQMQQQHDKFTGMLEEKMRTIAKLQESLSKEEQTSTSLKQTVKGLETKNTTTKNKFQELTKINSEKDQQISQLEAKCKSLEEDLQKPPPEEKLRTLVLQSHLDLFELLNFDKLESVEDVRATKTKIKVKLKERLEAIKLAQAEKKLKQKEVQIERLKELVMCPICMDQHKNTIYVPCGHALCTKCSNTILGSNSGRCPICRMDVESQHPFYL